MTFICLALLLADPPAPTAKEALAPLNDLIGTWKGSGSPNVNNAAERRRGSWSETLNWAWHLKGEPHLVVAITGGKHFKSGTLKYRPASKDFELTLVTTADAKVPFAGPLEGQQLTLTSADGDQRLVLQALHGSRMLYRLETREKGARSFTKQFQVGATKEGSDFAKAGGGTDCIVTGGAASIPVSYKGKTYYVCCSGCKEAFEENPEQILKEYAERKAKEAKEKGK